MEQQISINLVSHNTRQQDQKKLSLNLHTFHHFLGMQSRLHRIFCFLIWYDLIARLMNILQLQNLTFIDFGGICVLKFVVK